MNRSFTDMPFEFSGKHGTVFRSTDNTLQSGVFVLKPKEITPSQYLQDHGEMVIHHNERVRSHLPNGTFFGYDQIEYIVEAKDPPAAPAP